MIHIPHLLVVLMLKNESTANGALVKTLYRCTFLDEPEKIMLVDKTGTGKTRIATAIVVQAIVTGWYGSIRP